LPDLVNGYQGYSMVTYFQVCHRFVGPMEAPTVGCRASAASVAEKLLLHCPDVHRIAINDTCVGFKPSFRALAIFRYSNLTIFQTFN